MADAEAGQLQGTWQAVRVVTANGLVPDEVARRLRYTFVGDRVTLFEGDRATGAGIVVVHERTTPAWPRRVALAGSSSAGKGVASQTRTVRSRLAEASRWPSGLKATASTMSPCPPRLTTSCPLATSRTLTAFSQLPAASRRPSRLNATLVTTATGPRRVHTSRPLAVSQTRTFPSMPPAAIRRPSRRKATQGTMPACAANVRRGWPVTASHSCTVPSDRGASCLPWPLAPLT
jgi:hypothetical protein